MSHTPGPWTVGSNPRHVIAPDGYMVAYQASSRMDDECKANARLIAAAPEMLAMLRKIAETPCDHGPAPFCPREDARALLARIDGQA